jgi:hypothetical protein
VDRVFLDANILFSAAYRPYAGLRQLWEVPDVELVTSAYAVEEARRNLDRPEQRAALQVLLQSVEVLATSPGDPPSAVPIELAEKDRPILAMAVASGPPICSLAMCDTSAAITARRWRGCTFCCRQFICVDEGQRRGDKAHHQHGHLPPGPVPARPHPSATAVLDRRRAEPPG